jgi:hypothetical protein
MARLGRSTKNVLQPYEEGKLEIFFDTRRFRGRKTKALRLEMTNGKMMETMFTISAEAQDDPQQ